MLMYVSSHVNVYTYACTHTYRYTTSRRNHRIYILDGSVRPSVLPSVCPYVYVCMDGWMDGWMDGRMDGWMDG